MWQVAGYRQVRELGSGASGRVVHAVHEASGTAVAIKYIAPQLLADSAFRERFRAEARLLAGLSGANVVRCYDYVEDGAGAAIVMELVDGVTLRRMLDQYGPMPPEAALLLLKGSLLGLQSAHTQGVVHRDYKPANVMVRGSGETVLTDFGIAVPAGATVTAEGTPAYLAPEQWHGVPASPSADVYAATVVCFECLTGQRPYPESDLDTLSRAHATAPIPVQAVPEPVRGLVAAGLAKDPAMRPGSASGFLAELESVAKRTYGTDWEATGRKTLAGLAGALAAFFPAALALGSGSESVSGAATAAPDPVGATGTQVASPATPPAGPEVLGSAGTKVATAAAKKGLLAKVLASKAALIGASAVAVGAIVTGAVLVGNSGSESPPAQPGSGGVERTEPTGAPGPSGENGPSKTDGNGPGPKPTEETARPKTATAEPSPASDATPEGDSGQRCEVTEYPDGSREKKCYSN
ncbi:serine/threonine-protein kinase [Tamaricihabitans halophyticus]|uniref:Serine/threonine-protein kinase n=1 Tax=Tamaricihabitans halophyticus TaxID=1262583 RepID=A0A4R2QW08_9PSEU|nr:serine/threonine-protein kinase [Tamaricihabitans halophyticus]TCP54280.1 serine/threonine-protein kinase [Tamaricihabitans halophyticus]